MFSFESSLGPGVAIVTFLLENERSFVASTGFEIGPGTLRFAPDMRSMRGSGESTSADAPNRGTSKSVEEPIAAGSSRQR